MKDFLARQAAARPGSRAVEWREGAWSYRELDRAANAVAELLGGAEVESGRAVAVALPRGPAAIAAVHGVPRAGAALSIAGEGWTEPEMARFLDGLRPAAILVPSGARPPAGSPAAVSAGRSRLSGIGEVELFRLPDWFAARSSLRGVESVIWTSGTGGAPRGVLLDGSAHRAVARAAVRRLGLGHRDRWLVSLSLSHVGGIALVHRAAASGARLVLRAGPFRPDVFCRLASEGRVTHASLVPAMLHGALRAEGAAAVAARLRCVLVGGAATPPPLLALARASGWPVALTYGLSEAASQVATAPPQLVRRKPGTVGHPLPGVRVRISERSEILVKGPGVMCGYLSSEGSAQVIDTRGWLHTGDGGRLDEEGHLWVRGRLDLRLVSGGETVDPEEVEAVLAAAPGVEEVAVTGVPDEVWGDRIVAMVRLSPPAYADTAALEVFARKRLSGARLPRSWLFVEEIPRNPHGKTDRVALRRLAAASTR